MTNNSPLRTQNNCFKRYADSAKAVASRHDARASIQNIRGRKLLSDSPDRALKGSPSPYEEEFKTRRAQRKIDANLAGDRYRLQRK